MPEVEFYMSGEDERKVIDFLLSSKNWLVPDLRYETADYVVVRDMKAYLQARQHTPQFFVLHDSWSTSPLELHEYTWQQDSRRYYCVMQRHGGPTIDLDVCNSYEKSGALFLASGGASYYAWYWDTRLQDRRKPPRRLKTTFNTIVEILRNGARDVVTEKARRRYVVCAGAARDVDNGRIKLGGVFERG